MTEKRLLAIINRIYSADMEKYNKLFSELIEKVDALKGSIDLKNKEKQELEDRNKKAMTRIEDIAESLKVIHGIDPVDNLGNPIDLTDLEKETVIRWCPPTCRI